VSVSGKQGDHQECLKKLVGEVKKGASKADIWTLRDSLLAEDAAEDVS
jgi:hypothetical protein